MNVLIVYAHPNPKSFCHAIMETAKEAFEKKGGIVRVRDLYALHFNPVLTSSDFISLKQGQVPDDIAIEQEQVKWAKLIVMIYPIWWTSMPAILKGYLDRVFSNGFAFIAGPQGAKGLLPDKNVYLINTLGNSHESYAQSGMFESLSQTLEVGVFEFSSMPVIGHTYLSSVPSVTHEARVDMLNEVKRIVENIKVR